MGNTFFNPVYDENPTYDHISSVSPDVSSPTDATGKEAVYADLKEPQFPQYAFPKEITPNYDVPSSGGNEKTHPVVKPFNTELKGRRPEDNIYTLPIEPDQPTGLRAPLIENAVAIHRDISCSSGEHFSVQAPVYHDHRNVDSITTGGQEQEAASQVAPQQAGPHYENNGAQSGC